MVLEPSEREHARMQAFMEGPVQRGGFPAKDDYNTQSVWRRFYTRVFELPVAYNAFRSTQLTPGEWDATYVLHDADVQRQMPWTAGPALRAVLSNLTDDAGQEVTTACERSNITNRG